MAAKRPVPRTKEGVLELKKSEGMRKVWKAYNFKVSSSTYLHYFKTDMYKPEGQILIPNVTDVFPSTKAVGYPFEVHFRGKGSPWKLNAPSNEERISWMDAILPNSSKTLTQFKLPKAATLPPDPPTHMYPTDVPPPYSPPQPTTSQPSSANTDPLPPPPSDPDALLSVLEDDGDDFLFASLPPSASPQEYLLPVSHKRSASERVHSNLQPKRRPVPSPRSVRAQTGPTILTRRHTAGVEWTSRPLPGSIPEKQNGDIVGDGDGKADEKGEGEGEYVMMMAPPAHKRESFKASKLSPFQPLESPQEAGAEVGGDAEERDTDENNYVITEPASIPDRCRPGSQFIGQYSKVTGREDEGAGNEKAGSSGSREGETYSLADTISTNFTPDQIGLLIDMLQKVRVVEKQSDSEVAAVKEGGTKALSPPPQPATPSKQDSVTLRGNLQRALSYAPSLTENILVTDEDSEFYQKRPKWAKAVNSDDLLSGGQLDTLGDLQRQALHLLKTDLTDFKLIGQGQFGKVFKGVLNRGSESVSVALKVTRKAVSENERESFLREMDVMSQIMHPNIVRLYGLVTEDVPSPWMVLEYMKNGDLKTFLTDNQRPMQQLVKYMIDVSMGMHYISERGLVHRDLAARNVLVDSTEVCKVADFGLLREIPQDESIYVSQHNVPCPIRWMPPESIANREFSPASDVWSFGILVWEMFNPTKLPYEKYDNLGCAAKVSEGLRLPIPRGIPSVLARIMKACWQHNANKRPSFLLISTLLSTQPTF